LIKEISAKELENACRKCTRIEVSNTSTLARVLDANNIEYDILSDIDVNVYGSINLSKLVIALAKENCEVISSREQDESLENYFINLVGGKHNG
jgi:ABC-2 type transport system ATP-binding protein